MRSAHALALISALALSALVVAVPAPLPAAATTAVADPTATETDRISGPDRYATAVAISSEYPAGVGVVYVASGANFPDALSAAPAASLQGGPLLLTPQAELPDLVRTEISRLRPARIVVVGGPTTVSNRVYDQLATIAPVRRDAGLDRYETSRIIIRNAFGAGADTAIVATGANFPDALSGSAAAGGLDIPVILVDGAASGLDSATRRLLADLGVSSVTIVGGDTTVSAAVEGSLRSLLGAGAVTRLAGPDRYVTSQMINAGFFTAAPTVYLAVGTGFADALAGAALAGRGGAPLFVVPTDCVPADVLRDLQTLGTTRAVLLGGPASLGAGVARLTSCSPASTAPPVTTAPSGGGSYPLHTNIVATTFWVGEIFDADLSDGSQVCSTYDGQWALHHTGLNLGTTPASASGCPGSVYGGCDGRSSGTGTGFTCVTERRTAANGYFPTQQPRPLQNPFYLDLPFDDLNDATGFSTRCATIPWAAATGLDRCADDKFSYMKNRWVQITGPNKNVCYGQIEDAGPSSGSKYHDAAYVFGSADARPANLKFSGDPSQGAGMDVSPALNGCLGFASLNGDSDHIDWRFIDRVDVPAGPWLTVETTSQVSW